MDHQLCTVGDRFVAGRFNAARRERRIYELVARQPEHAVLLLHDRYGAPLERQDGGGRLPPLAVAWDFLARHYECILAQHPAQPTVPNPFVPKTKRYAW